MAKEKVVREPTRVSGRAHKVREPFVPDTAPTIKRTVKPKVAKAAPATGAKPTGVTKKKAAAPKKPVAAKKAAVKKDTTVKKVKAAAKDVKEKVKKTTKPKTTKKATPA